MRIGLNLLFLIPNKVGGTETYARGLLTNLVNSNKSDEYILFCNKENYPTFKDLKGCQIVELPIQASNKLFRLAFEQIALPFYLKKYKVDLVHSLGYTSPFFTFCPSIVTIYDLNWYYHPEDFGVIEKWAWQFFITFSARCSTRIITSSNSSKKSLSDKLGIDESKIDVIYGGVPQLAKPGEINSLRKLGIKEKYLFTVIAAYPHKNLITLLQSFVELRKNHKDLQLVVAGLGGRARNQITSFILENGLTNKVLILGWVTSEELSTLYKNAEIFVFPSKYEGFGFPVLEAMFFRTPLVSSDAFSLKEVVGDAGILVNPEKPSEFSEAIDLLLKNSVTKEKLIKREQMRLEFFSWNTTAKETVESYNKCRR